VDEAFLFGYDGKSSQAAVPDFIRDLAVHRKDYSVDIWFIAQHPKLLHQALRRQVARHQHYRRMFGWGRAVVYEWDSCQDNLAATKTAVKSNFAYPRDVFKAYKSAQVHTKPKFKFPWWIWLPVVIIPAAAWAFPAAFSTLSGAMTGKGIPHTGVLAGAPAAPVPFGVVPGTPAPGASAAVPVAVPVPAQTPLSGQVGGMVPMGPPQVLGGCIVANHRCGCFDVTGKPFKVEPGFCESNTGQGNGPPITFADTPPPRVPSAAELDTVAFAFKR